MVVLVNLLPQSTKWKSTYLASHTLALFSPVLTARLANCKCKVKVKPMSFTIYVTMYTAIGISPEEFLPFSVVLDTDVH